MSHISYQKDVLFAFRGIQRAKMAMYAVIARSRYEELERYLIKTINALPAEEHARLTALNALHETLVKMIDLE